MILKKKDEEEKKEEEEEEKKKNICSSYKVHLISQQTSPPSKDYRYHAFPLPTHRIFLFFDYW